MECALHEVPLSLTTTASRVAAMSNDDRWALRAELEARRDEIATLRGVVAALRERAARRRGEPGRTTIRSLVAAAAVGALLGFALAFVVVEWLRRAWP